MKTTPVTFHLTMDNQERAWLESRIEHYFTNAINGTKNLFDSIGNTIEIMEVLKAIKNNSIVITVTHYQANLLVKVIYSNELRMNPKTGKAFLPDDFNHRDIYDQLVKLSKRTI